LILLKINNSSLFIIKKGSTSIIQKAKESSDPMDQLLPSQLNDLVDNFM